MVDDKIYKLKKLVKELKDKRGRHTELVSVFIPAGYSLHEMTNLLSQEVALTQNVKSKTVRKNVIGALTKILQHLKLYKRTPENGLALFCGNISEKEGVSNIELWAIEPHEPVKVKLYWCDQTFKLEPLEGMVEEKDVYGIFVMDLQEATIGLLKGKNIKVLKHMSSIVPGKQKHGGQSAARFGRVRQGLIHDWFKQITEIIRKSYPSDIKGILVGGPGPAKEDFLKTDLLPNDMKKKIIGMSSTGYSSENGLHELLEREKETLKETSLMKERELLKKFFSELEKDSGLVTYGLLSVVKYLQEGAVETILISEDSKWEEIELECSCGHAYKKFSKISEKGKQKCPKCGKKMGVIGEMDLIDAIEDLAKEYSTTVEIISRETKEGDQLYQLGGVGAVLRYKA